MRLLAAMTGEMRRQDMQSALGLKREEHFREAYFVPALTAGLLEMTIPGKPRSGSSTIAAGSPTSLARGVACGVIIAT